MKKTRRSGVSLTFNQVAQKEVRLTPDPHHNGGFTLIELLVVVLIIGILAAVAVPQYQKAVEKSRISEMIVILNNLEKANELHRISKGIDDEFNPLTEGDIDYSAEFIYDEDADKYCNSREICINSLSASNVTVEMRKKSGRSGPPDYYLESIWDGDTGQEKWIRRYASCGVNIASYGLENAGYTRYAC